MFSQLFNKFLVHLHTYTLQHTFDGISHDLFFESDDTNWAKNNFTIHLFVEIHSK